MHIDFEFDNKRWALAVGVEMDFGAKKFVIAFGLGPMIFNIVFGKD